MKTLVIIFSAIGLLSLNSCTQKTDPNSMIKNLETRTELFETITSNHDYMTEFIQIIQGKDHALQMMQSNKKMMSSMMHGEGMQIMMTDSMMMKNMMQGMMKDGKMMWDMMKMMHEKGMMSEDCMESCKKMMGEKGMDKMGNMNEPTKEDHTEHH